MAYFNMAAMTTVEKDWLCIVA